VKPLPDPTLAVAVPVSGSRCCPIRLSPKSFSFASGTLSRKVRSEERHDAIVEQVCRRQRGFRS
jgi:hypothetical protein